MEIYKEKEFSELPAEILRMLLFSNHLSCGEEEMWEGLKVLIGDNRDMVEVAQMRLLSLECYIARLLPAKMSSVLTLHLWWLVRIRTCVHHLSR